MSSPLKLLVALLVCLPALLASVAGAAPLVLRVAALPNDRHVYYVELLKESLRAAGYDARIELVDSMPQPRIWSAVRNGQLSITWGVQTRARDEELLDVENGLTNGIIGLRVLMIRKGAAADYAKVRTLAGFRALGKVGGAGEGWFEAELWQHNRLPVVVRGGDWNVLFGMVAAGNRGVDYVIRGAHEAGIDIKVNPGLAIEPHLLLMHDRDMHFYINRDNAALKPILEDALARADRSGLKKRLIAKYLLPALAGLDLDARVRLHLDTPLP